MRLILRHLQIHHILISVWCKVGRYSVHKHPFFLPLTLSNASSPSTSITVSSCSLVQMRMGAGWFKSLYSTYFDSSAIYNPAHTHMHECVFQSSSFPCLINTPHRHIHTLTHTSVNLSPAPPAPWAPLPVAYVRFLIRWMQELVLLSSG